MRIQCASFVQRILRPRNPRLENAGLLALISRRQKRLYIAARNTLEIHKPAIYHDNIEKILTEVRKSRSLSDCVVGADGLEPPTLSV